MTAKATEAQHGRMGALVKQAIDTLNELDEFTRSVYPKSAAPIQRVAVAMRGVSTMVDVFDDEWYMDKRRAERAGATWQDDSPYPLPADMAERAKAAVSQKPGDE